MKAGQIMTRPTILPRGDDGDLIPTWAFVELQRQKERDAQCAVLNNVERDGKDQASDLEVALYLMCGSLEGPITEQACRVLLPRSLEDRRLIERGDEVVRNRGRTARRIRLSQLGAFKRWIRKQQIGAKNKTKILAFIRMLDGTIVEWNNFDSFVLRDSLGKVVCFDPLGEKMISEKGRTGL